MSLEDNTVVLFGSLNKMNVCVSLFFFFRTNQRRYLVLIEIMIYFTVYGPEFRATETVKTKKRGEISGKSRSHYLCIYIYIHIYIYMYIYIISKYLNKWINMFLFSYYIYNKYFLISLLYIYINIYKIRKYLYK